MAYGVLLHFHISRHQRQRSMVIPIHLNILTTPRQIQPNSVCNRAYTSLIRVSNLDDAYSVITIYISNFVILCFLAAEPHVSLLDSEVLLKLQIAKQVSTQSRAADHSTHIPPYSRLDTDRFDYFPTSGLTSAYHTDSSQPMHRACSSQHRQFRHL